MLAGTKELFIVMALFEQPIHVVRRVFQTVLIEDTRTAGQAHGGESVVLRDDDVPGTHAVDEGKIDAVRAGFSDTESNF